MMSSWRSMQLEANGLPQLFVKAKLDESGYAIHLTDLCRVWGETLTKRDITRRAIKTDCSVDPSEGDDQYRILLEKLEEALEKRNGAFFELSSEGSDADKIQLKLRAPLPDPLPDFEWQMDLALLPTQYLERELITPLLYHAHTLQSQIQQLVHELAEKDRVISKITDRLETSGNDLTTVFPGVSNIKLIRKKSQREQLARHVRGLSVFDEAAWRSQVASSNLNPSLDSSVVDSILTKLPVIAASSVSTAHSSEWWRRLGEGSNAVARTPAVTAGSIHTQENGSAGVNGNADTISHLPVSTEGTQDDFQRQATPPRERRLVSTANTEPDRDDTSRDPPASHIPDDESTEDEDDLNGKSNNTPSHSLLAEHNHVSPTASRAKFGVIGGSHMADYLHTLPVRDDGSAETSTPSPRKLGMLGGKVNQARESEERAKATTVSPEEPPLQSPEPTTPSSYARKLGVIGGKNSSTALWHPESGVADHNASVEQLGEPATAPRKPQRSKRDEEEESPDPRETPQERADRKRAELKRQMEERAKAPAKKKRKF